MPILEWLSKHKDLLALVVALAGGMLALFRYWTELAWQRRQFAFDYADKILADPACQLAMTMIDWYASKAVVPKELAGGREISITWRAGDVGWALRLSDSRYSVTEFVIRNAFDALLNKLERLAYFVENRTLSRSDFPEALAYYFRRVARRQDLGEPFFAYAEHSGFHLTAKLGRKLSEAVTAEPAPGETEAEIDLSNEMQFGPTDPAVEPGAGG